MINREDMLELTRRMTGTRSSFDRIAGAYMDEDGFVDGTFNTHFLKLKPNEKEKNLALAKAIPYAMTNVELQEYEFPGEQRRPGTMWHMLNALNECGLKNDAMLDTFYEVLGERLEMDEDYGIFVFHDRYDVPVKGADKERQWESEEVYEYLIVSIAPVGADYEPGKPVGGFLYPSFSNRSCYRDHVAVFATGDKSQYIRKVLVEDLLKCK